MPAPTAVHRTPDGSPIDAHLEAERAALHAERAAAATALATEQRRERWHLLRAAGLGFLLAGTIAVGWNHLHQGDPQPKMCTADGLITDDGTTYTRDPEQDCAWVDADGHPIPVDADGRPTG